MSPDEMTSIVEAVHRYRVSVEADAARLRAEDEAARVEAVVRVLFQAVEIPDIDDEDRKQATDLARAILDALAATS